MLKELPVAQQGGEPRRRWFVDDYFDLIVWLADDATISGFQLCYDRLHAERALTWTVDGGYTHNRIDDGEGAPTKNQSPILLPDGWFDVKEITTRFVARSAEIDGEIRRFVERKLAAYQPVR